MKRFTRQELNDYPVFDDELDGTDEEENHFAYIKKERMIRQALLDEVERPRPCNT